MGPSEVQPLQSYPGVSFSLHTMFGCFHDACWLVNRRCQKGGNGTWKIFLFFPHGLEPLYIGRSTYDSHVTLYRIIPLETFFVP